MAHSRWSPSAASREVNCPASFLLNDNRPRRDTKFTTYGTAGHYIGEQCLRHGHDPDVYLGMFAVVDRGEVYLYPAAATEDLELQDGQFLHEVDREMVEAVQQYIDRCRAEDGDHYVEVRVEHTRWCPDVDENGLPIDPQYGTSDHICVNDAEKIIFVDDLKMGRGLKVDAQHNYQALSYALGTINDFDWLYGFDSDWTLVMRIHQPLIEHFSEWRLPLSEALELGEWMKQRRTLGVLPDPPFGPDEKSCKFCEVKGSCKAYQGAYQQSPAFQYDDLLDEMPDVRLLDDAEITQAWNMVPLIKQAIQDLDAEMHRRLNLRDMPEHKMVERKTHRRFTDFKAVEVYCKQNGIKPSELYVIADPKPKSPAQVEKMLPRDKRKQLAEWTERPRGEPVIVSKDDPRPAYAGAATLDLFDSFADDEALE